MKKLLLFALLFASSLNAFMHISSNNHGGYFVNIWNDDYNDGFMTILPDHRGGYFVNSWD